MHAEQHPHDDHGIVMVNNVLPFQHQEVGNIHEEICFRYTPVSLH
jgi:hypothetical protein